MAILSYEAKKSYFEKKSQDAFGSANGCNVLDTLAIFAKQTK